MPKNKRIKMKKIIILLNIVSLLSIIFAFASAVSIIGTGNAMNIHIPVNQSVTIKTPLVVIVTLVLDMYWIAKKC